MHVQQAVTSCKLLTVRVMGFVMGPYESGPFEPNHGCLNRDIPIISKKTQCPAMFSEFKIDTAPGTLCKDNGVLATI